MEDSLIEAPLLGSKSSDEVSGEGSGRDSLPSPPPTSPHAVGNGPSPVAPGDSGTLKTPPPSPSSPAAAGTSVSGPQEPPLQPRTTLLRVRTSLSSCRLWPRNYGLPILAPRPRCNWFHSFRKWVQENQQKDAPLDSIGVEKVIGTFGFSLFGSLSLYPCTVELIKDKGFTDACRSAVLLRFGSIWVLLSIGVLCGLHGRLPFEQALCRHTGRLGLLGLALLLLFHIYWTLPKNAFSTALFWMLWGVAVGLHFFSWAASEVVDEDIVEKTGAAEQ